MSKVKRGSLILSLVVIALLASVALAWMIFARPDDKADSHYATLADVRADRLFERGWLPDVLPPSTRSIRVSNNVDLNLSFGGFDMAGDDSAAFYSRLNAPAPAEPPFGRWPAVLEDYAARGYSAHYYEHDGYLWAFFCAAQADHCDYLMWNTRSEFERWRVQSPVKEQ